MKLTPRNLANITSHVSSESVVPSTNNSAAPSKTQELIGPPQNTNPEISAQVFLQQWAHEHGLSMSELQKIAAIAAVESSEEVLPPPVTFREANDGVIASGGGQEVTGSNWKDALTKLISAHSEILTPQERALTSEIMDYLATRSFPETLVEAILEAAYPEDEKGQTNPLRAYKIAGKNRTSDPANTPCFPLKDLPVVSSIFQQEMASTHRLGQDLVNAAARSDDPEVHRGLVNRILAPLSHDKPNFTESLVHELCRAITRFGTPTSNPLATQDLLTIFLNVPDDAQGRETKQAVIQAFAQTDDPMLHDLVSAFVREPDMLRPDTPKDLLNHLFESKWSDRLPDRKVFGKELFHAWTHNDAVTSNPEAIKRVADLTTQLQGPVTMQSVEWLVDLLANPQSSLKVATTAAWTLYDQLKYSDVIESDTKRENLSFLTRTIIQAAVQRYPSASEDGLDGRKLISMLDVLLEFKDWAQSDELLTQSDRIEVRQTLAQVSLDPVDKPSDGTKSDAIFYRNLVTKSLRRWAT